MYCAAPISLKFWNNRDNQHELILFARGAVLSDLSSVERVTVDLDGGTTVIDSDDPGMSSVLWWTDSVQYRGNTVDVLRMALGHRGIDPGTYDDVSIVIYDPSYPEGLRLENVVRIRICP